MGDTLPSVAASLSMADNNYSIWDKGQLLVILACTKLSKDTIFVVNKKSALNSLVHLFKKRRQWTQYTEDMSRIVKINHNNEDDKTVEIWLDL